MNMQEYTCVQNLTYREYCDYLLRKYGVSEHDYMTPGYAKNPRCTRTAHGLLCHHIYEDTAIQLSHPVLARRNPFEWQKAENLVFCNLLEHLFLHVLICQYPAANKNPNEAVGVGGVVNFLVPELNDLYSGFIPKVQWQLNCHNVIRDNQDVYLAILNRFKLFYKKQGFDIRKNLLTSAAAKYGNWRLENNDLIFRKIMR